MLRQTPVVILAGGLGTRLRPVLSGVPKGLASIGNRPFLQIQIELLRDQGASRFVLCIGHMAEQIQAAFGDGSGIGVHIDYSVERGPLLGTGGALKQAERFFRPRALVLNGDTYLDIDYNQLVQKHHVRNEQAGALATLTLARAEDSSRFGSVLIDETDRLVRGFREKDGAATGEHWLNAGVYVIERALLGHIPADQPASLERDVLPAVLHERIPVAAVTCSEPFYDIGTPRDLELFVRRYEQIRAARRAG